MSASPSAQSVCSLERCTLASRLQSCHRGSPSASSQGVVGEAGGLDRRSGSRGRLRRSLGLLAPCVWRELGRNERSCVAREKTIKLVKRKELSSRQIEFDIFVVAKMRKVDKMEEMALQALPSDLTYTVDFLDDVFECDRCLHSVVVSKCVGRDVLEEHLDSGSVKFESSDLGRG